MLFLQTSICYPTNTYNKLIFNHRVNNWPELSQHNLAKAHFVRYNVREYECNDS